MATGRCSSCTGAGDGARLMMLVMHDDAKREYALWPCARAFPPQTSAPYPGAFHDEAKKLDCDQHEERLEAHLLRSTKALDGHEAKLHRLEGRNS